MNMSKNYDSRIPSDCKVCPETQNKCEVTGSITILDSYSLTCE